VTFTFTGTSVRWMGLRAPHTGVARIFLNGSFHAEVDTYSPAEVQTVVFAAGDLPAGTHELAIEVTGRRHAAASDHRLVIDAFDVGSRFEEAAASIAYSGSWTVNMNKAWSGTSANTGSGTAVLSAAAGARAEFTFSGGSATWVGYRGPQAGIARVYVDGVVAGEVDAYSATEQVQAALFTASGLSAGSHTLAVEVTGTKHASSSGTLVVVDAFDVQLPAGSPRVSRFQESDAEYPAGPWSPSTRNFLDSGGFVNHSVTAGARVEFAFTGTSIRWVGQRRRDTGIARVYLDGVLVADVDTFAALQDEYQAGLFSRTGLANQAHTLAIEVTGLKNPQSSGALIVVDAFDVSR
jgi:hypothetical protein